MFSLFSCKSKNTKENNIEFWLNEKFPDKFVVLNTNRDLQPRNFIEKKMTSVIASKEDPEVQGVFDWYKDKPDLGLSTIEVQSAFDHVRRETGLSRELFQSLIKNGITNTSVAVVEDAAYFLVYVEPTPDNRRKYLQQILTTLDQQTNHLQTSIWIEFMEDSIYQHEFKDIIPKGYWARKDGYHQHNKTVSLYFDWTPEVKAEELMTRWTVNTESNRSTVYREEAYKIALKWAEKNISPPFYVEPDQMVQYEIDHDDPMSIHFYFPYFPSKPPEDNQDHDADRKGFVSGVYQVDKGTFWKIKTEKEL
jgi:hypothetical protein